MKIKMSLIGEQVINKSIAWQFFAKFWLDLLFNIQLRWKIGLNAFKRKEIVKNVAYNKHIFPNQTTEPTHAYQILNKNSYP